MEVYLASKFNLAKRVKRIATMLQSEKIGITVKWWEKDFKKIDLPDDEWYKLEIIKQIKERNFNGIDKSDAVILICPINKTTKFNGANIEVGYALGKGKPVYSVGKIERSGMYYDVIKCESAYELISKLKEE
jgi:nucleoside 2-deoxyribosyltransferase